MKSEELLDGESQDDVIANAAKLAVKKLRDQLEATENARVVLKDTLCAYVQDHVQETLALRDYKRKTESIVQSVREFLHNVKARNVAGLDDLACDPSLQQMETALREFVGCLEVLSVAAELRTLDAETGKKWRENSSLENWFPYTAEELSKIRAQLAEIYSVASGERQVTNNDTEALAWIAERCKKP